MTRPKVDPDKRQRTACACDSCKRRKQKCNGHKPCNTCVKRHLSCVYTPTSANPEEGQSPVGSPTKRRFVDRSPTSFSMEASKMRPRQDSVHMSALSPWDAPEISAMSLYKSDLGHTIEVKSHGTTTRPLLNGDVDADSRSRSTASGAADEAEAYSLQRMLQDSTGRLLYVGDSATLSYLQLIRMLVESISGQSAFTMDPKRHMIMEAKINPPPTNMPSGVLPDRRTADVLVESYFLNTTGFIEVFDKTTLFEQLNQCYHDPLTVDPTVLCLLNLVFAIGLVLSRPEIGSEEERIVRRLCGNKDINRADVFFRNAKGFADPVSGIEDADFWSVQALLLMAVYMLVVSKRNAAYVYYGMAVRLAFALGLHREEDSYIFSATQTKARRNLWRTLYVIDRFLAASLGRPTAISDDDCSEHALDAPEKSFENETDQIRPAALDAAVKTCRVIGDTLKQVYSKRKISTTVAQEIAEKLEDWGERLNHALHWQRATVRPIAPSHGIAILHINLLHCHSIILLARPFFLYILKAGVTHKPSRLSQRMESFAKTCVEAAQHTLNIGRTALDTNCISQCNPFVVYFVFAAGLIILSNEFASLYHNPDAGMAVENCISILKFCAERDAQAQRVLYIVEAFHEANSQRPAPARSISFPNRKIPIITPVSSNPQHDPMAQFFAYTKHSPQQPLPILAPNLKHERSNIATAHPSTVPRMISSVLQQPSPDATGSSPVNSSVITAIMPGLEAIHGSEMGFDFDDLWPTWDTPHHGAMPLGQSIEPADNYGHYTIDPPPMGPVNVLAANTNAPLYETGNFH